MRTGWLGQVPPGCARTTAGAARAAVAAAAPASRARRDRGGLAWAIGRLLCSLSAEGGAVLGPAIPSCLPAYFLSYRKYFCCMEIFIAVAGRPSTEKMRAPR